MHKINVRIKHGFSDEILTAEVETVEEIITEVANHAGVKDDELYCSVQNLGFINHGDAFDYFLEGDMITVVELGTDV